ncbi:MAG: NADH-quinone oxidoreductase subunit J family protein [Candidatus Dormibacteria bacterium]
MQLIFFAVVAALSATSGLGVVLNRKPLYSALSLVVNMLSLALLFLVLSAQFLAAAQVIVYAGAVMVLFVFVIALLNPGRDETRGREPLQTVLAVGLGAIFTGLAAFAFLNLKSAGGTAGQVLGGDAGGGLGTIQALGQALYRDFAYPFEVTSLVLVVAAIGAVYLSRGR